MMKQFTVFLGIFFMSITGLYAQVEIKALVGTNFATLSKPAEGTNVSARAGYQFGAGLLIGDKFYVEPGIQIVKTSKTLTSETETDEITFSQNFVKIPVYAGYHLLGHESGPVALRIFAGPAAMISGKITKGDDQINKDDIKDAHWMLDAGVGVDILFLFVEVNYEYAFSKYWTEQLLDSSHRGFLINAGIHIDF